MLSSGPASPDPSVVHDTAFTSCCIEHQALVKALIMHLNHRRVHATHVGGEVQACTLASAKPRLGGGREAAEHSASLSARAEAMLLQEHTVACLSRHSGSRKWEHCFGSSSRNHHFTQSRSLLWVEVSMQRKAKKRRKRKDVFASACGGVWPLHFPLLAR